MITIDDILHKHLPFKDDEVTKDHVSFAMEWLKSNTRLKKQNTFVDSIRVAFLSNKPLSIPQIRGLLNSIRADVGTLRKDENNPVPITPHKIPYGTYCVAIDGKAQLFRVEWAKLGAIQNMKTLSIFTLTDDGFEKFSRIGILNPEFKQLKEIPNLPELMPFIENLLENPKEAAIEYGKRYGRCCICGRTLSNPISVEAGMGPICAGRF